MEIKCATRLIKITPAKKYQEPINKFVLTALVRSGITLSIKAKEIPPRSA